MKTFPETGSTCAQGPDGDQENLEKGSLSPDDQLWGGNEPPAAVVLFAILVAILLIYLLDQFLRKIYRLAYRNALFSELTGKMFRLCVLREARGCLINNLKYLKGYNTRTLRFWTIVERVLLKIYLPLRPSFMRIRFQVNLFNSTLSVLLCS